VTQSEKPSHFSEEIIPEKVILETCFKNNLFRDIFFREVGWFLRLRHRYHVLDQNNVFTDIKRLVLEWVIHLNNKNIFNTIYEKYS
jgi:hypothetical protein